MKMLLMITLAVMTFLFFFYSATLAMSLVYGLDSALLTF